MNDQELGRLENAEAAAMADAYRAAADARPSASTAILERDGLLALAVRDADSGFFNRAIGLGVGRAAIDADLDALVAFYRDLGRRVAIVHVAPDAKPVGLDETLAARGCRKWTRWAKCWRSLGGVGGQGQGQGPGYGPAAADGRWRVERLEPMDAARFTAIAAPIYDVPPAALPVLAATVGRPGWTHYLGSRDGAPASVAAMYVQDDVAWFGYAATVAEMRGQGGQTALLRQRLRDAVDLGCRYAVTETGEEDADVQNPSLHNLDRAGFSVAYLRQNWLLRS